jgi:hypothetical protein
MSGVVEGQRCSNYSRASELEPCACCVPPLFANHQVLASITPHLSLASVMYHWTRSPTPFVNQAEIGGRILNPCLYQLAYLTCALDYETSKDKS